MNKILFCLNCNSEVSTMPTEERACCPEPNVIECDDSEIKREQATRKVTENFEIVYTKKTYIKAGNFKYRI